MTVGCTVRTGLGDGCQFVKLALGPHRGSTGASDEWTADEFTKSSGGHWPSIHSDAARFFCSCVPRCPNLYRTHRLWSCNEAADPRKDIIGCPRGQAALRVDAAHPSAFARLRKARSEARRRHHLGDLRFPAESPFSRPRTPSPLTLDLQPEGRRLISKSPLRLPRGHR